MEDSTKKNPWKVIIIIIVYRWRKATTNTMLFLLLKTHTNTWLRFSEMKWIIFTIINIILLRLRWHRQNTHKHRKNKINFLKKVLESIWIWRFEEKHSLKLTQIFLSISSLQYPPNPLFHFQLELLSSLNEDCFHAYVWPINCDIFCFSNQESKFKSNQNKQICHGYS